MAETRDEIGEEIRRLLGAVQDWARRFPDTEAPEGHSGGHSGEHSAGGQCLAWCPICQFANVLRGEHPEVTERLTEAANAIGSAVKALADAALTRAQPDAAAKPRPRPAPRVEHISLDEPAEN
ncbi:MAG TPA: hypothetical protein VKB75_16195 [Jatrophihabitans sp.]|nr:hypothetical protein [Jatrophihabitans sp.]